jgi:hypothetical protein
VLRGGRREEEGEGRDDIEFKPRADKETQGHDWAFSAHRWGGRIV